MAMAIFPQSHFKKNSIGEGHIFLWETVVYIVYLLYRLSMSPPPFTQQAIPPFMPILGAMLQCPSSALYGSRQVGSEGRRH